jgi:hypothetical protein
LLQLKEEQTRNYNFGSYGNRHTCVTNLKATAARFYSLGLAKPEESALGIG